MRLIHWRLYALGLPFDDVNDEFIAECLRVGAPLSGGTREKAAYEDRRHYRVRRVTYA
ncbi:hypothetical protein [Paenibacillus sp. sgz5001063]|uniref:hypothetical protein n=1 Tax=Paenibacillus sp. sgz5001063 TaxID=3242474 RepID=UPI0036D418EE